MKNKKYQAVLIGILLVGCSKSSPYYPPANGTASPTPAQTIPTPTPTPTPAPTPTTPTPAVAHGWTSVATLDSSVIAEAPSSFLCFEKQSGDRDVHFYGGVDWGIQGPYASFKWARYILGTSNPGVTPPIEFGNLRINRNRALMMSVDSQAYALGGDINIYQGRLRGQPPIMHFVENPTGTGYWEDASVDSEQGYYFELNSKMMRLLPIIIGNYRTLPRPIPTLEEYNPTTKTWNLITDQGLDTIKLTQLNYVVDEKLVIVHTTTAELTQVDLSHLPNVSVTTVSLNGLPMVYFWARVIWSGNGKIFLFAGSKSFTESGVHEYDLAANTFTRRVDLDPPFELWSQIIVSNKGRPEASGASYVFLIKEFNPSRTTPHTYAYDDRHRVYAFRP